MRELKFRAWDKENKEMFFAGDLRFYGKEVLATDCWWGENCVSPGVKRSTILMQYTGLKDKNGVEIYESDIVKYWLPTLKKEHIGVVSWNKDFAGFWLEGKKWSEIDWMKLGKIEVIGDIYQHPELLED